MSGIPDFKNLVFKDTSFANLMNKRIYNVLLIATKYDAFMLEDDGRVDEQIFNEYTSLSLRYPPRFTQVTTEEEALAELKDRNFELIICMPNMDNRDIFAAATEIKIHYPNIPIVVLTPFSKEVSKRIANEDLSAIDYVFSWLGNAELLLAIIKLIEDKMNAPDDTASVGVQIILLVEDSVRFYSSALPHLYKFVLEQSQMFAKEALNDHQRTLRMRGRPKIKLARTYEEAVRIFNQYRDNMLGIISDMSFMHDGVKDPYAGYKFGQYVRKTGLIIPFVLESSEASNKVYAKELGASFIDKNSKSYPQDLRKKIMQRFGFGDFVILNPQTKEEIMRIKDLKDLQKKVFQIPDDSLVYHLSRNHFSRFFYSRAMFPPAEVLKRVDVSDYKDMDEARKLIFDLIVQYRRMKNSGVVAVYQKERFDEYSNFARIGDGSLGGKGRGLAFIGAMVKRYPKLEHDHFAVTIPKTVVICTDIFDEFMETNELYPVALSDVDDETILNRQTEQVKMIFTNAGFKYYIPSYEGLYNIFIGSIIGRENNLNPDYLFLSDLHSSLCMGINYSTFRSDKEGILFNERLYQTPIRKDVWDADKKRIPARNMIIVASTGGGKSVTSLNIIQQNIEQNYKQIVVEFGKSFYQLSQLYPDRSLHIDYDGSSPLGINPFYTAGKQPDNEKIKTLVNLVLKFWRSKAIMEDTKQVVSLTKIICRYYEDIPDGHCFPDFYRYVQREGKKLYERLNILPEYFDIDSFLHVCSEFMPGGFYENVCKPSPLENDMQNRDFIVFELTKIKKDPFLISVIMTILFDTIENKILSDRSVRGMLIFDEYAESQSIKDTFSGADIHSTVAFCYQKLRKENGAVGTIVQSLAQLPDNEYTKGIIANTQLLYVLPANEIVYDQTVEAFHIKNRSHVNLMKSIRNDFSGVRPYSEIFIRFMDSYATVVRLELSPEKLLAFQTDGEKWNKLQEIYKEAGSMETAIEKYKQLKQKSYETEMSM